MVYVKELINCYQLRIGGGSGRISCAEEIDVLKGILRIMEEVVERNVWDDGEGRMEQVQ